MNMSEAYLLRDEPNKNAAMLLAALNHTYTTDDFKEEILTDKDKERACEGPHSNRQNGQGTGDMPEAWGNANTVDLLRDMLVSERTDAPVTTEPHITLHLLGGLPAAWIAKDGSTASVERTPTTLGTAVSVKFTRVSSTKMRVEFDPGTRGVQTFVHVPLPPGMKLAGATMDGRPVGAGEITTAKSGEQAIVNAGKVAHRSVFDFTLAADANTGSAR